MKLPVRLVDGPIDEPSILVDGFARVEGCLVLSHWPGNTTPEALRHELSTGSALAFARLPDAERKALAGDARAIVNNHFDTDGVLSLFAVRHPELAVPRAQVMLDAAAAGDFYHVPNEHALIVESVITALGQKLGEAAAIERLMDELPRLLDGELDPYRGLYEARVEAVRADRERLATTERIDDDQARLTAWIVEADEPFDAMRHALFSSSDADRVMVVTRTPTGTSARLIISTRSWFALPGRTWKPRPDLGRIANRLNELARVGPESPHAWRAQPRTNASPELWFGRATDERFCDRLGVLEPGELDPGTLLEELASQLAKR